MNLILNSINFIKCKYEVVEDEIGKDNQILNNKGFFNLERKNKEILNKINTIINGKILSNILTYKFDKEGSYDIYITSNYLITDMSLMFYRCYYL